MIKGTPAEAMAFSVYEWMLNRYVARSLSPSGYYTIDPISEDVPTFEMWLEGTSPSERDQIRGRYETKVTTELVSRIDKETEFWEVGGGWGYHSLALAPLLSHATAFEANEQRAEQIILSAELNGYKNVDVVQGLVGNDISLDNHSSPKPPDIILLDVEGQELDVLEDSPETLAAEPLWVVEIHEPGVPGIHHGVSAESVFDIFEEHGYKVSKLSQRKPGNFHVIAELN